MYVMKNGAPHVQHTSQGRRRRALDGAILSRPFELSWKAVEAAGAVLQGPHAREEMPRKVRAVNHPHFAVSPFGPRSP